MYPIVWVWEMLISQVTMTVKLTHTNERTIRSILQTYRSELSYFVMMSAADMQYIIATS